MKWINRLEARFGRFAVPNVTLGLVLGQVLAYAAVWIRGDEALQRLWLIRERVLEGEVWRLFTFVFMPPAINPIFAFFAWYLFYLMGTALERHWGVFRYNVYLLIGVLAAMTAGMLVPGGLPMGAGGGLGATGYLVASVFLAFAFLYPDFVIHLFLVLPIRIKWLALITWVLLGLQLFNDWPHRAMVAATVFNFLIFFGGDLIGSVRNWRRRTAFEARIKSAAGHGKPRHRCAVCGITNLDDPRMQFRYCSQCEGPLCYCSEHLRDHEHVTSESEAAVAEGHISRE